MSHPTTAVVILNYNGLAHLQHFLPRVVEHSPGAQVVVADNASTDGSAEYVQANFPQVRWLPMEDNRGFAGGYNAALRQVQAEVYILLNNDAAPRGPWLEPLWQALQDPTVHALQPKMRSERQPSHFDYAGAAGGKINFWGLPYCLGRSFSGVEEDTGQYDGQQHTIDWASGACLVIRSSTFWQHAGFEEAFFAHMEEIDLCWRIRRAGGKVVSVPDSVVYHLGGGTLDTQHPRKLFLNFRNNAWMLRRNGFPRWRRWVRFVLDVGYAVLQVALWRGQRARAVWQGVKEGHCKAAPTLKTGAQEG